VFKVKVFIAKDERYPEYCIVKNRYPYGIEIELTTDEYQFIVHAEDSFNKAQDLLRNKIEGEK